MSRVRNEYPFQQFKATPTRDMAIKAKCTDCAGGPGNGVEIYPIRNGR